jgi:ABC-type polysaccharide/polyol phosphate transport system ATPase subunit
MNDTDFSLVAGETAVRLRGLRKVYKLYRKPSYRLRDILGILPTDKRYYSEHVALHDVSLDIRRGEKVAIIGRNGAGKSTLLRLITKVIEPSAGSIQVNGETQALLSRTCSPIWPISAFPG